MSLQYKVGIDIGGTNVKVGIIDLENNIIAKHSVPTDADKGFEQVVQNIIRALNELAEKIDIKISDCMSIGIGCPGITDAKTGVVVYSNNLYWNNAPLSECIAKEFSLPVKISNDANCAALGEAVAGVARSEKDMVLLTLGTGVGGGIVLDGNLFEGGGPANTEVGHMTVQTGGRLCTCGRNGCLEAYASATALIASASDALKANPDSKMAELVAQNDGKMDGKIPFDAALLGDEVAIKVIDDYIFYLGEGIVNLVNLIRPKAVVLSGGVCAQGEKLTVPLTEHLKKHIFGGLALPVPKIIIATLGNDAGMIGAANL